MQDFFITKISIKKVRHLENIDIELSPNEKKHLIITGKNGSGKTSLLLGLNNVVTDMRWELDSSGQFIANSEFDVRKSGIKVFGSVPSYDTSLMHSVNIFELLRADRKLELEIPKSIEKVELRTMRSKMFIKFLLYLNYQMMFAKTNNNSEEAEKIEKWFSLFLNALREVFDCPMLELKHDSKDLSYKIIMPEREPFGLNEMADGYSAFLHIVMELMMKMENQASMTYDVPGIVFIDEIETHLHIELQKRVLPFLIKMFPRIQFIVTTHSPFIITSISNAVVYDLEKKIAVEDMSAYSYEAVIKHYYDIDMYSIEASKQFDIYKSFINKQTLSPDEMEQFVSAIAYLKQIPAGAAEELVYAFREMEIARRQKFHDKAE